MPTLEDQRRAEHQAARFAILLDDFDDIMVKYLQDQIGEERAQVWGIPDTSANPLADLSRQLTTPGLYGKRPTVRHSEDPKAAKGFTGLRGLLDKAGFFTRMSFIQYLTIGAGDMLLRWDVGSGGKLVIRNAWPFDIYLRADPDDPSKAVELWELRLRWFATPKEWRFVWEVFDIGAKDAQGNVIREPSHTIRLAKPGELPRALENGGTLPGTPGGLGLDVSDKFIVRMVDGQEVRGALVGDAYPWKTEDGDAVLPYSHYQDSDTGGLWNWWTKRGLHIGTLNSALFWTYAGHCARDATGSYVIIWGLHEGANTIIVGDGGGFSGTSQSVGAGGVAVKTKLITNGAMEYHKVIEGQTPGVHEVGPGQNLNDVVNFAILYDMTQAVRMGLSASDVTRNAANPTSAAALSVTNEGKRDFSARAEPVFRRSDLDSFEVAAVVTRAGGIGTFPERGYTTQYVVIPRTPQEEQERRDQLTWEEERGQKSEQDVYQALHEGATDEDAEIALITVALEKRQLTERTAQALIDAGFPPTPALPSPPSDPDPEPQPPPAPE